MKGQFSKSSTRSNRNGNNPEEQRFQAKSNGICTCDHCTYLRKGDTAARQSPLFNPSKANNLKTKKKLPKKLVTSRWIVPPPEINDCQRSKRFSVPPCRCLPANEGLTDDSGDPSVRPDTATPIDSSTVQSNIAAANDYKDEIRLRESFNAAIKVQEENQKELDGNYQVSPPPIAKTPVRKEDVFDDVASAQTNRVGTLREEGLTSIGINSETPLPVTLADRLHTSSIGSLTKDSLKKIREILKNDRALDHLDLISSSSSSSSNETVKTNKGVLKPPMSSDIRKQSAKLFAEKPQYDVKYRFSTIDNCGSIISEESIEERVSRHLMNEKARESAQMRLIAKSLENNINIDFVSSLDEARIAVLEKTVDGCTWGVRVYKI